MPVDRRARAPIVGAVLVLLVGVFSVEYTVERGDTLSEIARDQNVSLFDLVDLNDIENPDLIFPGQVLLIPGKDGQPDKVHVVLRGDTLVRIASSYGASVLTLARVNSLGNPNLIFPGQELMIPAAGKGKAGSDGESEGPSEKPTGKSYSRSGRFHIVQPGESLESIAAEHKGVSAKDIANANGILNGVIYRGTRLFLDGAGFVAGDGGGAYTVKKGDRLGDIAARFGTSVSKIADANKITNIDLIRAGQTLVVPGAGSSWVCPVKDASFFNDWGFPRAGGARYHEGNDLFASYGAPVRAPVSGTVELKTGQLGGLQFNLHGDDGVEYLGSHLDSAGKTGKVKAGDTIGYVGTSGNAQGTRPHLHFGIYLDGLAVNPYPTLIASDCK